MNDNFNTVVSGKPYIKAGEIKLVTNKDVVWTILGSCISIVFYSENLHEGLICHAQLPIQTASSISCEDECPKPCKIPFNTNCDVRYVASAFEFMVQCFENRGVKKGTYKTHIYGGASQFGIKLRKNENTISEQNIETALKLFKREGLSIDKQDTGGNRGRKLIFFGETGEVFIKNH